MPSDPKEGHFMVPNGKFILTSAVIALLTVLGLERFRAKHEGAR